MGAIYLWLIYLVVGTRSANAQAGYLLPLRA